MKGGIVMKIIMVPKIGMPLTGHFDAIRTNGEPYAIGGSVRGLLYNRPVSDYDFTIVGGDVSIPLRYIRHEICRRQMRRVRYCLYSS